MCRLLVHTERGAHQGEVNELEASIRLDKLALSSSRPLPPTSQYERFYAAGTQNGDAVIFGELLLPTSPARQPGIRVMRSTQEFPVVFDGGCAIIHLTYSVKERTVVSARCNSVA